TDRDAAELVLAENMFNEEPEKGFVYAMVPVSLSYDGDDASGPWLTLGFALVGGDGNTYSGSCGVTPDDISGVEEMYAGASADANVCVAVKKAALKGAAWRVEESFGFDEPAFFALK